MCANLKVDCSCSARDVFHDKCYLRCSYSQLSDLDTTQHPILGCVLANSAGSPKPGRSLTIIDFLPYDKLEDLQGFVITHVDGVQVTSREDVKRLLAREGSPSSVQLRRSGGQQLGRVLYTAPTGAEQECWLGESVDAPYNVENVYLSLFGACQGWALPVNH